MRAWTIYLERMQLWYNFVYQRKLQTNCQKLMVIYYLLYISIYWLGLHFQVEFYLHRVLLGRFPLQSFQKTLVPPLFCSTFNFWKFCYWFPFQNVKQFSSPLLKLSNFGHTIVRRNTNISLFKTFDFATTVFSIIYWQFQSCQQEQSLQVFWF